MSASIVPLPARHVGDIPRMLRHLADEIEKGKYGDDAGPLVWVLDCGPEVQVGGCGQSAEPGAVAYLLLGHAMRKLEGR